MASDSIVVPPDPPDFVLSDVRYLLEKWRPRELVVDPESRGPEHSAMPISTTTRPPTTRTISAPSSKRTNRSTRVPSFYDKHFLVLEHIRLLDSLVNSIAETVDANNARRCQIGTLRAGEDYFGA
jgi:hypothetical protein